LLLAKVAVTMRTLRDRELRKPLEKDQRLRHAMGFSGVPHRTSIGRRLVGLVPAAEQQIALLGQRMVDSKSNPKLINLRSVRLTGECTKRKAPSGTRSSASKVLCPSACATLTENRSGQRAVIAAGFRAIASPDNRNNWECTLLEAALMTGLERNADLVVMASYAPLFAHTDAWQWTPNMIWFDNMRSFGTPNYYV